MFKKIVHTGYHEHTTITNLPLFFYFQKKMPKNSKGKYRQYEIPELLEAVRLVTEEKMSIYRASKLSGIPWSTIKDFLKRNGDDSNNRQVTKLGRPFALTAELEMQLFNYIIKMQEIGFGLTVQMVRKIAYQLAEHAGRDHFFNTEKESASQWWWTQYKNRFNLTLRVPENLAAYRASMSNPEIIQDFFTKLETLMDSIGVKNCPDRLWNCDETGLSYVVKPNRVVTSLGKRYVYKRAYADRGESQTLMGCICANGTWIPPLIIFKGVRWNELLKRDCLPNAQVKLSQKGWINSEIFLEWFRFFIESIPPARPVILFMDSHASHINPAVISLASENDVYLFTFPAHTSHLLQPLDVGIYKSLKSHWSRSLNTYMTENAEKPNRTNFHSILNPAFISSFSASNIENAFRKSGICPFDRNAISKEALAPSLLTANPEADGVVATSSQPNSEISKMLPLPTKPSTSNPNRKKRDSRAKCLNPQNDVTSALDEPSTSSCLPASLVPVVAAKATVQTKQNRKKTNVKDDDWECGMCGGSYSLDAKNKNGAKWVQCCYCLVPYHVRCHPSDAEEAVFMCDMCGNNEDSDED